MAPREAAALWAAALCGLLCLGAAQTTLTSCYAEQACTLREDVKRGCDGLGATTCESTPTCAWTASVTAAASCAATDVCSGLDAAECGTTKACNLVNVTVCPKSAPSPATSPTLVNTSSPAPTAATSPAALPTKDPLPAASPRPSPSTFPSPSPSNDPCASRSSSFAECVLGSPAADQCSFTSMGCQMSWSALCYQQPDETSCAAQAESGCSWTPYTGPPSSPAPASPAPYPGSNSSQAYPAPWQLYPVPELPADYFTANASDAWWSDPDRSGHGPFDYLTPPLADALLRAKASSVLCPAVSAFLRAAAADLDTACEASLCGPYHEPLTSLLGVVEEAEGVSINACELCQLLVQDGLPALNSTKVIDFAQLLAALPSEAAAADSACPALIDGLLWVARSYAFLPSLGQPVAAAMCPAVKAIISAAPQLFNNTEILCFFFELPKCNHNMAEYLDRYDPATVATDFCFSQVPEIIYDTIDTPSGVQAIAQEAAGYCTQTYNAACSSAKDTATCSLSPGCRWASTCSKTVCSPWDTWCLQRQAAMPACLPLVNSLVDAGGAAGAQLSLSQICSDMGLCPASKTAASDPMCLACKTAVSELVANLKAQEQWMKQHPEWYQGQSMAEQALSSCTYTYTRLSTVQSKCGALAALDAAAVAVAKSDPAQLCSANSALCKASSSYDPRYSAAKGSDGSSLDCSFCTAFLSVYKDLASAGVVGKSSADMTGLCYSLTQHGGDSADELRWQVQWRWGCSPEDQACCQELPTDSFLSRQFDILGVSPQTASACSDLPGCTADSYCFPSWSADGCRSIANRTECADDERCQWFGYGSPADESAGTCVDAVLSAKCRLAGEQGGATGCAAVQDDMGLPLCQFNQYCHTDWAVTCWDPTDTCCLTPLELFSPEAPDTCANHSTSAYACAHSVDCITTADPCSAFISKPTCQLASACTWHPNPSPSYPGWCTSSRDQCSDFNNQPDACTASPACRAVPRCARSYCRPHDECCLTQGAAECRAKPGCGVSGWCGLTQSACWYAWDAASCANTTGCAWQTYTSQDGEVGGWCAVQEDPCSPHSSSALACAAVVDPLHGTPLCKYQSNCYDACESCRGCVQAVGQFAATQLPKLIGNASGLAHAARDFCTQNGGDWWSCVQVFSTVAARPEAAARPAALCKAINQCSSDCVSSLGLTLCSTTGFPGGAIKAAAVPSGTCKSSATCSTSQACDTSACVRLSQCDATTGFDVASCGGSCMSKCALQRSYLEKLNAGTCLTDSECDRAKGETCQAVAGRTCARSVCSDSTGAITSTPCTGFCSSGAAPSLVSAKLTDDGRRVLLRFDTAVSPASSSPSALFAASTASTLGTWSQVYSEQGSTDTLAVWLSYDATIAVGDLLTLRTPVLVASSIGGVAANAASVPLQAPASPAPPQAVLSGPASVGSGCAGSEGGSTVVIDGSASPFSAGRAVTFQWTVQAAASHSADLSALAAAATQSNSARLVMPGTTVAALAAGDYTFKLTVKSWLDVTDSAQFTLTKVAAALPVVAVVGGPTQTFAVSSGIRLQTAIDLASVCPGKSVTYLWQETSGLLPAGSFVANRSTLAVKGPVPVVSGGDALAFTLTTSLAGAGSATTSLTLTAQSSAVMAVLTGPRGDVRDTQALSFSASSSLDPDDVANTRTPFSFLWTCTALDTSTQVSAPCFADPATAPDLTAATLRIPAGLLPASDSRRYTLALTASKGGRSDTDSATLRVLAGPAPVGTLARFCPGAAGCTSKLHRPSDPLRLVFTLADPTLLPRTTFAWSSADVTVPAGAKQTLVIQPFTAAGAPVFADGSTVTVSLTTTADGKTATTSLAVPIARRPACTAASCLSVSPASGPTDATTFAATASGFAADGALTYDWGTQDAEGRRQFFARGTGEAAFTFAPRVLPVGDALVFVCAKDATGAQACSTASISVTAATQTVTAADVSSIAASLSTAVAAGSTDALVSAVRQLSAAGSSAGSAAASAVAAQAEGAMGALETALSGAGASVEESLGVASAAQSLVESTPTVSPALADSALTVAASALQTVQGGSGPVQASDLDSLLDIAAVAGPALASSDFASGGSSGSRRLLGADSSAAARLAALEAVTRTYSIVSASQEQLLAGMVAGESACTGTGDLVACAAAVDPASLGSATQKALGRSGASVTLLPGLASWVSTTSDIHLMLSYTADPSLLLTLLSDSAAQVPAPALTSGASRALLSAPAPAVNGSLSSTVVSGYVNLTSSLNGAGTLEGQAFDVALPLTAAYDSSLPAMCLRLDAASEFWRSDGISLTGVSGGAAHCSLSSANDNQVLVVQYVEQPAESPSPSPSPPADEVTVTVPQLTFTAHISAYDPSTFTAVPQQQYVAALRGATSAGLLVTITDIRAGSVRVDTTLQFLVSNGNAQPAAALAATLANSPESVLPSAAWGAVSVENIVQSTASITVPASTLTAPPAKAASNKKTLIAALVGSIGGALLLAAAAVCVVKARRRAAGRAGSLESEMVSQPTSPTSPQAFLTGTHTSAPAGPWQP